VWDPLNSTGLPAASGVVVSASRHPELTVTLERPLAGITCGANSKRVGRFYLVRGAF
jgi:hypothetical protein